MFKRSSAIIWITTIFVCSTLVSLVGAETQTAVVINNVLDVKVSVRFKCYSDTSWETNSCPSTNGQALYIESKKAFAKAYNHPSGCQNIYINFSRYDRSSESCTIAKKFQFIKNEPRILNIRSTGTGPCAYTVESTNGTVLTH